MLYIYLYVYCSIYLISMFTAVYISNLYVYCSIYIYLHVYWSIYLISILLFISLISMSRWLLYIYLISMFTAVNISNLYVQVTALDTGISMNMFYGDPGSNVFISKLFRKSFIKSIYFVFMKRMLDLPYKFNNLQ